MRPASHRPAGAALAACGTCAPLSSAQPRASGAVAPVNARDPSPRPARARHRRAVLDPVRLQARRRPPDAGTTAGTRPTAPRRRNRRPVRRARQRRDPQDATPETHRRAVAVVDLHQRRQRSCWRPRPTSAAWPSSTSWIEQAQRFEGQQMSPETARAIKLLKLGTAMPAPKDPAKLAELTQIATKMEGMYGAGKYCTGEGDARQLPPARRARGRAAQQPRLRRAARRLAGLAHHRPADAQGLHALRRAGQRGRARHGLRRRRRDVALGLRHDAGRARRRNRPPVGPGQAAVRAAALLHARASWTPSTAPTRARSPAACCPRT